MDPERCSVAPRLWDCLCRKKVSPLSPHAHSPLPSRAHCPGSGACAFVSPHPSSRGWPAWSVSSSPASSLGTEVPGAAVCRCMPRTPLHRLCGGGDRRVLPLLAAPAQLSAGSTPQGTPVAAFHATCSGTNGTPSPGKGRGRADVPSKGATALPAIPGALWAHPPHRTQQTWKRYLLLWPHFLICKQAHQSNSYCLSG